VYSSWGRKWRGDGKGGAEGWMKMDVRGSGVGNER